MNFFFTALLVTIGVQVHARYSQDQYGTRRYIIAIGKEWGAYNYVNSSGYHQGFSRDILEAVCEEAGIICDQQYNPYNECIVNGDEEDIYRHHELGPALQMEAVDGCANWLVKVERLHLGDFGASIAERSPAQLYVLAGKRFDISEAQDKKIGFMNGWFNNRNCLAGELGIDLSAMSAAGKLQNWNYYYIGPTNLVDALKSGEVDAGFNTLVDYQSLVDDGTLEIIQENGANRNFMCALRGPAMFAKPGSPLIADWNRGMEIIRKKDSSGQSRYDQICAQASTKHGHKGEVLCLE